LLRDEREIKRQNKRSNYLNNYKLNSIAKRTQRDFDNLINFNRDNRDNRDKRNYTNINLRDRKRV